MIPPHPGVLSALGLAAAAERIDLVASCHRPLAALAAGELAGAFGPLLARAATALPGGGATLTKFADCRFAGQGYEVTVPVVQEEAQTLEATFITAHRARYGRGGGGAGEGGSGQPVELVNLRVVAERGVALPRFGRRGKGLAERPARTRRAIVVRGEKVPAEVWPLDALPAGLTLEGPAILAGTDATALLEPGWRATVHPSGAVIGERR